MFQAFNKQDDIWKNIEEIPVTVPVYEGYLYWYSEKHKWKWHLFRFDGLSFICLSTRKVKLPRDTPIEQDDNDGANDDNLNKCVQLPSPTSPLLATPKHPYTEDHRVVMASHYQLPSWSVNLSQVTSISLLALNDKSQQRNCFCIRTTDNKCYLLKTRNHKELHRWLFILQKAWHWTQIQQQQQYLVSRASPPPQIPPLNISPTCDDPKKFSDGPPTPPPHFDSTSGKQNKAQHDYYEPNYTNPILSVEKEKWIDEWRDSLQSMAMPSPMCHKTRHSTPAALDSHDHSPQRDPASGIHPPLQHQQQYNIQRPASMSFLPLANCQLPSSVKKKRSNEVKNWISSHPPSPSPQGQQDYDVQYFQDVNTTECANDFSTHHNSNSNLSDGDKKTATASPLLHYHRSTRGKNVQIITNNNQTHHQPPSEKPAIDSASSTPPFDNHSPLHVLSKAESTHDVYKLQSTTTTRQQQQQSTLSPTNTYHLQDGMYYHPQRSSASSIVAPSLPPIAMSSSHPSYYGMSSLSLKPQCSTGDGGGGDGKSIVFHPARSGSTTHGIF